MATHRLAASPETVRRGMLDGSYAPVLTVASGDTVVIECVSGNQRVMPPAELGLTIPPALQEILDAAQPSMGAHIVTGPVAIDGAEPGDTLEVRIERIDLGADWGYCAFHPLAGSLPDQFPYRDVSFLAVDRQKKTCTLPWGPELPLAPFFGIMAVEPNPAYGTLTTKEPC